MFSSTSSSFTSSPTSISTFGDSCPDLFGNPPTSLSPTLCHPTKYKTLQHMHQVTSAQPLVDHDSPSLKSPTSLMSTQLCSRHPLPQCFIAVKLNHDWPPFPLLFTILIGVRWWWTSTMPCFEIAPRFLFLTNLLCLSSITNGFIASNLTLTIWSNVKKFTSSPKFQSISEVWLLWNIKSSHRNDHDTCSAHSRH